MFVASTLALLMLLLKTDIMSKHEKTIYSFLLIVVAVLFIVAMIETFL